MLDEQFEELRSTGDLPSPSGVGMRILVQTQKDDCAVEDIVRTIEADPALTGRILKLASSSQFAGSTSSTTVKEAAVRLGLRTVSNVALGFTLISGNRSGRCRAFDYDHYWSWSLANAVAADVISQEFHIGIPAEAFTFGLLCRVGRLALASVHPTDYAEVLSHWRRSPELDLGDLERMKFRIDHREIAQAMMDDWGLPTGFGQAAGAFGKPEALEEVEDAQGFELLKITRLSCVLAELCLAEEDAQPACWSLLQKANEEFQIGEEHIERLCDEVVGGWHEWGEILKVPTQGVRPLAEIREKAERRERECREASDGSSKGGLRILAVDDDPVSLKLLSRHLERAGHFVVTASNGKQALASALEMNPQIVVTDWMMPEMDGLQFCKALRRFGSGRNMYVLLLTGRGEEDRIVEAFEAGVDDYIVKPFKPKLLLARIRAGQRVVKLQEQVDKDKKLQTEQVAKLAVLNRKLRTAALTDPLTDLPNRRHAMKRLDMEWANSSRSGQPVSVIMIDIDHFKRVNDTYGHGVGDTVLKETADMISKSMRRSDTCARMGGEEFLVICPNTGPEGVMVMAERIRMDVEEHVVTQGDYSGSITVSLGVATRGPHVADIDQLINLSDAAVYDAKEAGRNRIAVAQDPPEAKSA